MRKIFLFVVMGFFGAQYAAAQNIIINEEPLITKMMYTYVTGGKSTNTPSTGGTVQIVDGFRIQLLATTDRTKVDDSQSVFNSRYPGVYSGWSQAKPYYRVRVGAFTSRSEAATFLQKIKKDYPDAYIVPDRVKTSEITSN